MKFISNIISFFKYKTRAKAPRSFIQPRTQLRTDVAISDMPTTTREERIQILLRVFDEYKIAKTEWPYLLGQIQAEVGDDFIPYREGFTPFTSATELRKTFGVSLASFTDRELTERFVGRGASIALYNYVYDDYISHKNFGNSAIGDGWKYRGGGYFPITGKATYERADFFLKVHGLLVSCPELITQVEYAARTACFFWLVNINKLLRERCNFEFNSVNCSEITRIVNKTSQSYDLREKYTKEWIENLKDMK